MTSRNERNRRNLGVRHPEEHQSPGPLNRFVHRIDAGIVPEPIVVVPSSEVTVTATVVNKHNKPTRRWVVKAKRDVDDLVSIGTTANQTMQPDFDGDGIALQNARIEVDREEKTIFGRNDGLDETFVDDHGESPLHTAREAHVLIGTVLLQRMDRFYVMHINRVAKKCVQAWSTDGARLLSLFTGKLPQLDMRPSAISSKACRMDSRLIVYDGSTAIAFACISTKDVDMELVLIGSLVKGLGRFMTERGRLLDRTKAMRARVIPSAIGFYLRMGFTLCPPMNGVRWCGQTDALLQEELRQSVGNEKALKAVHERLVRRQWAHPSCREFWMAIPPMDLPHRRSSRVSDRLRKSNL